MFESVILDTRVEFPFEPYECQRKFMETTIRALQSSSNAALESPTGTGKTLSLLCSALAWLEQHKMSSRPADLVAPGTVNPVGMHDNSQLFPTIIYASRTHSQLQQVVRELNKTKYKYMKTCVLASRDQLCINERVMKEPSSQIKSQMCRNLAKAHKCQFSNNLQKDGSVDQMYAQESPDVPDIEDLVNIAKKFKHCPYYRTQTVAETADLILLPYNYVFDPKVRAAMKVKLKGNILIIDEAHNLEGTCEDSVSIEWSSKDNALCIKEVRKVLEMIVSHQEELQAAGENSTVTFDKIAHDESGLKKPEKPKLTEVDVAILLQRLLSLEEKIDAMGKEVVSKKHKVAGLPGAVYPGVRLVKLLEEAEFMRLQRDAVINVIDMIGLFLAEKAGANSGLWAERGTKLAEFASLISRVFTDTYEVAPGSRVTETNANAATKNFLLYVERSHEDVVLKYWCFSASTAMQLVASRGLRSIIVASGTLSPLPAFLSSMGIHFPYTLENEHIAKKDQIMVGALRRSKDKVELLSTFKNRSNNDFMAGMALTLLNTVEVTPQGVLVFFASYTHMKHVVTSLQQLSHAGETFWKAISKLKEIFVEPKSKVELPQMLAKFDDVIRSGAGAVFFAVCRGKISEGIDLPDSHCRAVFLCGIPYSPPNDPRVILKKYFLQNQAANKSAKVLAPEEWYRLEGLRAVNQAIGRVIRHKEDFGVVVLADIRFATVERHYFSAWLRPGFKVYEDPTSFFNGCERFFSERGLMIEKSLCKLRAQPISKFSSDGAVVRPKAASSGLKRKQDSSLLLDSLKAMYDDDVVVLEEVPPSSSTQSQLSVQLAGSASISDTLPTAKKRAKLFVRPIAANQNGYFSAKPAAPTKKVANPTPQQPATDVIKPLPTVVVKPQSASTIITYKNKMAKLPKNLRDNIVVAQRTYMTSGNLNDVVPALAAAISVDPSVFRDFINFVKEDQKIEFEALCAQHVGLAPDNARTL